MRNSSLVKCSCAENLTGLKSITEAMAYWRLNSGRGRGAFRRRRSCTVRSSEASGSENAGMSNDKASENLARRKPKVS